MKTYRVATTNKVKKIAIVGSGINGLCCAYFLDKQGWDIEIFDSDSIPNKSAASYDIHKLIHPWHDNGCLTKIKKSIDSLSKWKKMLNEIKVNGFLNTGVIAVDDNCNFPRDYPNLLIKELTSKKLDRLFPILKNKTSGNVLFFPEFGILFAKRILSSLIFYLKNKGVKFFPQKRVVAVDINNAEVMFENGYKKFDAIILASGHQTNQLLKNSPSLEHLSKIKFEKMRCYVLYGVLKNSALPKTMPAWASLGSDDLWGMPPVKNIPFKLGCGALTCHYESIQNICENNSPELINNILKKYSNHFSKIEHLKNLQLKYNHWAKINSEHCFFREKQCVIISSDNGIGFKFAPTIGHEVSKNLQNETHNKPTWK